MNSFKFKKNPRYLQRNETVIIYSVMRHENPQKEKLITEIKAEKQNSVNSYQRSLDGVRGNRGKLN
jgi:hypothetical protein